VTSDNARWRRGIVHPRAWHGDEGILVPKDGESDEECLASRGLDLSVEWRVVECRRPTLPMGHAIREVLIAMDEPELDFDWWGNFDDQVVFLRDGAKVALADALAAWAETHVHVKAWEIREIGGDQ